MIFNLLLFLYTLSSGCLVHCRVQVSDDFFHGFYHGAFHQMSNTNGITWDLPTDVRRLEVLSNDVILNETLGTCIDEGVSVKQMDSGHSKLKVSFEEVAERAGFNHEYRHRSPTKDGCVFDLVLNGPNNYTGRFHNEECTPEMVTGGAAAGDYDNDGLIDIFFVAMFESSKLYKNNGDGTFTDVTMATEIGFRGNGSSAGWVDVDSDGDLDLYVSSIGDYRHYLYINQGGYFTEQALERGISLNSSRKLAGMTPTFGDFDRDGYLDVFTSEWVLYSSIETKVSATRLFRNLGKEKPGYFEDVTDKAGVNMDSVWNFMRTTFTGGTHVLGGSFTDYDNDGWPELFIVGDFGGSRMFWNNRNGTFTECTKGCGIIGENEAMGYTIADLNYDGNFDFLITAVEYTNVTCRLVSCLMGPMGNGLYLGNNGSSFNYSSDEYGVREGKWGWGAAFVDYDNDGKLDIVQTSGFELPSSTLDDYYGAYDNLYFFENQGIQKKMKNIAKDVGITFNGMGRGVLTFDYDNDGDKDVVVVLNVGKPKLFKNNGGNKKNWIRIRPMHKCDNNEKKLCDSYGARVYVKIPGSFTQMTEVGSKTHFMAQSEMIQHFGVNQETEVDVTVFWPRFDKNVTITNVKTNKRLKIVLPEGEENEYVVKAKDLSKCNALTIKEITIQPGTGEVTINKDQQTVSYNAGAMHFADAGLQYFQYAVQDKNNGSTQLANVTLDFRGMPGLFLPMCANGKPVNKPNADETEERLLSGKSNNMKNLHWGSAGEELLRIAPWAYADNISSPAGACTCQHHVTKSCPYPKELSGYGSTRPSPRKLSNKLMRQTKDVLSKRHLSDMTVHYGQFLVHDIDHTPSTVRILFYQYHPNQIWTPISIPKGDVYFDPYSTGNETMSFTRSLFNGCTGQYTGQGRRARQQENTITAFLDANMVYGVDAERHNFLRTHKGGRMRVDDSMLLPKNEQSLTNENPLHRPTEQLYVAGDIRANVQPGLMALHVLFVREHNRIADEYMEKYPKATDEEAFQHARRFVISEIQAITFNEYLPAILGTKHGIPEYTGYKEHVNVGVTNEFSTAAFRFGHSQVNSLLFRLEENGEPIKEGHALLREVYFKTNRLEEEGGIDPVLRGAATFPSQEIDLLMVDEMRNNLFPQDGASVHGRNTGFDLASFNIQRGRDHGLADFNTVRKSLGLKAYITFYEITSDVKVAKDLEDLYKDINNIDLWVGGLAEDHLEGSELGETFHTIIVEQFTRIRDGDRFWYQRNMTKQEIKIVQETTLSKIIRMNSGFKTCPENTFFASHQCAGVKDHQCIERHKTNLQHKYDELKGDCDQKLLITLAGAVGVLALVLVIIVFVIVYKTKLQK